MKSQATVEKRALSRREILVGGAGLAAGTALIAAAASPAVASSARPVPVPADETGAKITTKDGVEIYYKDWGSRGSRSSSTTAGR